MAAVLVTASAEITCAVYVGYAKPAQAKSAYAALKIVLGFIVCATRRPSQDYRRERREECPTLSKSKRERVGTLRS